MRNGKLLWTVYWPVITSLDGERPGGGQVFVGLSFFGGIPRETEREWSRKNTLYLINNKLFSEDFIKIKKMKKTFLQT